MLYQALVLVFIKFGKKRTDLFRNIIGFLKMTIIC